MTLDELIDKLCDVKDQRSELSRQDKELVKIQTALESDILSVMGEVGTLKAMSGTGNTVTAKEETFPAITDPQQFYDHIVATGDFDLLQRRLSNKAFQDRWNQGEVIPGTSSSKVWQLSISRKRS